MKKLVKNFISGYLHDAFYLTLTSILSLREGEDGCYLMLFNTVYSEHI